MRQHPLALIRKDLISMTIYLYVKTHNKTGLKYLGKTKKSDPHSYLGSGPDWRAHLKEHGIDYTTEIIRECQTKEELNQWGRYYSNLWDVANSPNWANRIPETGGGGGREISQATREKIRQSLIGKPFSKERRNKISESGKGRIPWNKGLTKHTDSRVLEYSKKITNNQKGRIPWNKGKKSTQTPWNKGLTKETDPRVASYAKTLSIVNKKS